MFVWLIKQLMSIRKVLEGRTHPHQLAWGLALGFLVGVVPHGNLLAVALIVLVLSLRVNHSLVALSGVAVALLATKLDPITHKIGQFLLSDPRWHDSLMTAWQWPLMPWTDLNNTVVAGSFSLGIAMVLPLYAISYPIFRYIQPAAPDESADDEQPNFLEFDQSATALPEIPFARDDPKESIAGPHLATAANVIEEVKPESENIAPDSSDEATVTRTDAGTRTQEDFTEQGKLVAIETKIDVIRFGDDETTDPEGESHAADDVQMNQALGYLLRRLRDSQRGDAA